MTMQHMSFDNVQSQEFPGDTMLFLPLMHHQVGFNTRSLLQNASEHLQTHVQTIFESLPSLGFLPLLQSSGTPTLPPHMVFSTGGSPPCVPSSFGIHAPMSRAAMGMSSISLGNDAQQRCLIFNSPHITMASDTFSMAKKTQNIGSHLVLHENDCHKM
jgi:hypothetical protein